MSTLADTTHPLIFFYPSEECRDPEYRLGGTAEAQESNERVSRHLVRAFGFLLTDSAKRTDLEYDILKLQMDAIFPPVIGEFDEEEAALHLAEERTQTVLESLAQCVAIGSFIISDLDEHAQTHIGEGLMYFLA